MKWGRLAARGCKRQVRTLWCSAHRRLRRARTQARVRMSTDVYGWVRSCVSRPRRYVGSKPAVTSVVFRFLRTYPYLSVPLRKRRSVFPPVTRVCASVIQPRAGGTGNAAHRRLRRARTQARVRMGTELRFTPPALRRLQTRRDLRGIPFSPYLSVPLRKRRLVLLAAACIRDSVFHLSSFIIHHFPRRTWNFRPARYIIGGEGAKRLSGGDPAT